MIYRGASAYDQKDFLENYLKRRGRAESPNNAIEKPIIMELIQTAEKKHILDLGCGDALFGCELLEMGADSYTGVEGSGQMAELAATVNEGTGIQVINETLEAYEFPIDRYDLVTSRFVVHYIEDIEQLFIKVFKTLTANGRFIFSVQHPLTTSSFNSKEGSDKRGSWIVDDYFIEGERNEPWIDKTVMKYHRTIEHYFTALTNAGFQIQALREGRPVRAQFGAEEEFQRRNRIPLMLIFACEKLETA